MKKKWIVFLLILILFLLNLSGVYPKEVDMLPGDMEQQKNYNGGEVT